MGKMDKFFEESKKRNKQKREAKEKSLENLKRQVQKFGGLSAGNEEGLDFLSKTLKECKAEELKKRKRQIEEEARRVEQRKQQSFMELYQRSYRSLFDGLDRYAPTGWSDGFSDELNRRVMKIIKRALDNDKEFEKEYYQFEVCLSGNPVKSARGGEAMNMSNLALRGLFTSPKFIKAFFKDRSEPVDLVKFYDGLFSAENLMELIIFMEAHLPQLNQIEARRENETT